MRAPCERVLLAWMVGAQHLARATLATIRHASDGCHFGSEQHSVQNTQTIDIVAPQPTWPDGVLKDVTVAPQRYTSSEAPEECRARTTGRPPLPASAPAAAIPVSCKKCAATIVQRARGLPAQTQARGCILTLVPATDTECFAHNSVNHILSAVPRSLTPKSALFTSVRAASNCSTA